MLPELVQESKIVQSLVLEPVFTDAATPPRQPPFIWKAPDFWILRFPEFLHLKISPTTLPAGIIFISGVSHLPITPPIYISRVAERLASTVISPLFSRSLTLPLAIRTTPETRQFTSTPVTFIAPVFVHPVIVPELYSVIPPTFTSAVGLLIVIFPVFLQLIIFPLLLRQMVEALVLFPSSVILTLLSQLLISPLLLRTNTPGHPLLVLAIRSPATFKSIIFPVSPTCKNRGSVPACVMV